MRTLTLILLIAISSLSACKKSSQAMGSDRIEPSNAKETKRQASNEVAYAIIISFTSYGTGIDYELKKKIDGIINSFNKNNNTTINPKKIGWGREGEVDYNFTLKNLSTSQKESFISLTKEGIGSSERTTLSFDKKSVHKR